MPTVLISGANRGLGLEFARQYLKDGWDVIAGCRAPDAAPALEAMTAQGVRILPLDVADDASIAALAVSLGDHPIDLLLHNAGIYGAQTHQSFGTVDAATFLAVQRVNAFAPLALTQALLRCLQAAVALRGGAKVAVVSSKMGSVADNAAGGAYVYRASKAAANMVAHGMAADLLPLGIHLALLHPGWVRTDMGGPGAMIDPPESVTGMRQVIGRLDAQTSGQFFDYQGKDVAW